MIFSRWLIMRACRNARWGRLRLLNAFLFLLSVCRFYWLRNYRSEATMKNAKPPTLNLYDNSSWSDSIRERTERLNCGLQTATPKAAIPMQMSRMCQTRNNHNANETFCVNSLQTASTDSKYTFIGPNKFTHKNVHIRSCCNHFLARWPFASGRIRAGSCPKGFNCRKLTPNLE